MANVPYNAKVAARLERGETVLWAQGNPAPAAADMNPVQQWMSRLPNSVHKGLSIFFAVLPSLIIIGFLAKDFEGLRQMLQSIFETPRETVFLILGAALLGGVLSRVLQSQFFSKTGAGQISAKFFEHNVITDNRILLFDESGPSHSLTQSDINSAEFDWENGARVLRLSAKSPLQNVVLARSDIERAMQLIQESFMPPQNLQMATGEAG